LEPGKGPSSPSQSSLWPLALLGTLLFALWPSKRNQSSKSVHPQDSTDNKDAGTQTQTTPIAKIVPTPPDSSNPKGSKDGTPFWEKLAVVVAIGLLIVNICQMRSTEKAAIASKNSADTAAKELELSERPWISADIVHNGPLMFDSSGASLSVRVLIRNTGHSPALNTTVVPLVSLGAQDFAAAVMQPDNRCENFIQAELKDSSGTTVFPSEQPIAELVYGNDF